jgi:hypothetical protein
MLPTSSASAGSAGWGAKDPLLLTIHGQWEQALRQAAQRLPAIDF